MAIGVLALQGAFREHLLALGRCGAQARPVRTAPEIEQSEALIIPGGESTTMGKLMAEFDLREALGRFGGSGRPMLGTCAGMILMAANIIGSEQPRLSLMDTTVERNAYGRQVESFEADLEIPRLGEEAFRGVFIRAPYLRSVGPGVEVLCRHDGRIVLAQQGKLLAAAFHPELTDDERLHRYFLSLI